jgi:hypothetical protein
MPTHARHSYYATDVDASDPMAWVSQWCFGRRQVMPVEGQNSGHVEPLLITAAEFHEWVERHRQMVRDDATYGRGTDARGTELTPQAPCRIWQHTHAHAHAHARASLPLRPCLGRALNACTHTPLPPVALPRPSYPACRSSPSPTLRCGARTACWTHGAASSAATQVSAAPHARGVVRSPVGVCACPPSVLCAYVRPVALLILFPRR